MSVEYGEHGEEISVTSILVSIIMTLLVIPEVLKKGTEVVETLVTGRHVGEH